MKKNGDLDEYFLSPYASVSNESIYTHPDDNFIRFCVKADTKEMAIKVANERRVIILSHNLWGDNEKIKDLFFKED
jgi:hypothetical protein